MLHIIPFLSFFSNITWHQDLFHCMLKLQFTCSQCIDSKQWESCKYYVSSLIPCERLQASSYSYVLILGPLVYTVEPLLVEIVSIQIQIWLQVVIDFIWFCYIVFKSFIFSLSVDQTLCVSDTISKDHSNKYKYYTKRSH